MSNSEEYNIFEGLPGIIEGLKVFAEGVKKLHLWYHENIDAVSSYLSIFVEFAEWSIAIDKLIENQFVFTDNLNQNLAREICRGTDVNDAMNRYYFGDDKKNMKRLIQRCENSECIQEYSDLFDQIIKAYDRNDFLLACIGLFSLIDGLLADCSGIKSTRFKKRLDNISEKFNEKAELNEIDRKTLCICNAFNKFDNSVFKDSDFAKAEPKEVNRHWDVHGRTRRKHTQIDFLKVLLWLDAIIYLSDKDMQLGNEEKICEHL